MKNEYFEYALDKSTNKYVVVSKDYKAIKKKLVDRHVLRKTCYLHGNMKYKNNKILLRYDFEGRPLDIKYAILTMHIYMKLLKPINLLTYDLVEEGYGSDKELLK